MQRSLTFGYWAMIVGGLLLAVGSAVAMLNSGQPMSARALTSSFIVSAALRLLGAIALIIGVTAIFTRESDTAGRFGLLAYVLVIANMVLQAGWMWADLFLSGAVAGLAPGILDGAVDDPRLTGAFLGAWFMNSAFILLGAATLRARVFPRTVGWALIGMGTITLVPLPVDGPVYEVIIGATAAVAGIAARRVASVQDPSVRPDRELATA